ncbi:Helix-turn-helix domain-containing protein [Chitinophaga sp. CF118]|uniref:helix-turn-helix domain-containing protein n=1 Tax=Chitinophaga sp. CF118 TaxID=1884367 RepID=UPI0008EF3687|nr:helix-turn-helix domain-containing protein [Chitinophaga sp. CF118]SFE27448.1 Helix-turn-helix domain-containing protein [Chitinophaga sp. CF118]
MSYTEYLPHPALQSYIDAYWTVRIDWKGTPYSHRVLPDCCADIIYNTDESFLVGTMTTFKDTFQTAGSSTIGIRFKPGGIAAFYRLDLNEFTDQRIPYQDKELAEIIHRNIDLRKNLDRYFLNKLNTQHLPLSAVIGDITKFKGQLRVADLISRHAMSERKLERLFKQHTGVSVKGMIRLVRFTNALDAIRNNSAGANLTQIAYAAGYYDQAHLCNEVKAYTGLTPAQL